jgi:hypothetical protein
MHFISIFVLVYSAVISILAAEKVALFPHKMVIAGLIASEHALNLGAALMLPLGEG